MLALRLLAAALTATWLATCMPGPSENKKGNITAYDFASKSQKNCIGGASYIKGEASVWYTETFNSTEDTNSLSQAFEVASTEKEGLKMLDITFEDIHLYAVGGRNKENHPQLRSNLYECAKQHTNIPHLQRFYQSRPSNMTNNPKSSDIQGTRMTVIDPRNGTITVKFAPSGNFFLKNINGLIVEWHRRVLNNEIRKNPKVIFCLQGLPDDRNDDPEWNPRLSHEGDWTVAPIMKVFVLSLAERIPAAHLSKADGCHHAFGSAIVYS